MGSSMVMMWHFLFLLTWSTMAARVVDLPDPVGPVTSTRPLGRIASSSTTGGRPSSSAVGMRMGMLRNTAPIEPRWK